MALSVGICLLAFDAIMSKWRELMLDISFSMRRTNADLPTFAAPTMNTSRPARCVKMLATALSKLVPACKHNPCSKAAQHAHVRKQLQAHKLMQDSNN